MITIDGVMLDRKTFPDGTPVMLNMPCPHVGQKHIDITWCFDDISELVSLSMASMHYRDRYPEMSQHLHMPYVLNARMDRIKSDTECFTLKWFCNMVNALDFDEVRIFDVHSDVTPALLGHVRNISPDEEVRCAIESWSPDIVFYPDAGAAKRYGSFGIPILYGNKARDWKTGKIEKLDIMGDEDAICRLSGSRVLIVDDISSYGGTFHHSARTLRQAGAKSISLYVSHAEKNIFAGKLFEENDIEKLYTTDSLFTDDDVPEHLKERIVFMKRFRDEAAENNTHPSVEELRTLV